MQLAEEALKAETEASENPLANDPWYPTVARLEGRADYDGFEYVRIAKDFRSAASARLRQAQCNVSTVDGADGRVRLGGHPHQKMRCRRRRLTDRIRGYRRRTNRLPYPASQESSGKTDTSSSYVLSHVVGRLEADSGHALARCVRATP